MHILTNLPADQVSGVVVAECYRRRWTIENLFAEVTATLACEVNTLCYPKAALFVFSLALLASNAVAVVKASLRAVHGEKEADKLSGYYLALEIKQVHEGMMIALPAENSWCPLSIEQKGLVFYNSCTAVTTPGQHGTNPCHG